MSLTRPVNTLFLAVAFEKGQCIKRKGNKCSDRSMEVKLSALLGNDGNKQNLFSSAIFSDNFKNVAIKKGLFFTVF